LSRPSATNEPCRARPNEMARELVCSRPSRRRRAQDTQTAKGFVLPSVLERRRRIDQALYAVVMEAYVHGSRRARSTTSSRHSIRRRDLQVRGVEDLWAARRGMGPFANDPCRTWALPTCSVTHYVRPVSGTRGLSSGGRGDGHWRGRHREVWHLHWRLRGRGLWTEFLQSLRERGLHGVQLVISDSHLGLKAAIAKVFPGRAGSAVGVHFSATCS